METDKKKLAKVLRELALEIENDEYYEVMFEINNHVYPISEYGVSPKPWRSLGHTITINLSPKREKT